MLRVSLLYDAVCNITVSLHRKILLIYVDNQMWPILLMFSTHTVYFSVVAIGRCSCAIAQSPVSETNQQRHQVWPGKVAETTAVQDGAGRTVTRQLFVQ